jgi:hypothetical protein
MKTLYNTIQESLLSNNEIEESLLSDIDTTLARGDYDIILSRLFNDNLQQRREAFDDLRLLVESYRPKQHKTTTKMKNSDSYFVEFTYPIGIENGGLTDILDWISYIQICKRIGLDYRTVCISASDGKFGNKISIYELSWRHTQPNFNPKASNTKLYEVPEELNGLFKRIQMDAYKQKNISTI